MHPFQRVRQSKLQQVMIWIKLCTSYHINQCCTKPETTSSDIGTYSSKTYIIGHNMFAAPRG